MLAHSIINIEIDMDVININTHLINLCDFIFVFIVVAVAVIILVAFGYTSNWPGNNIIKCFKPVNNNIYQSNMCVVCAMCTNVYPKKME